MQQWRNELMIGLLVMMLAGCTLGVPQVEVTPTLAPTDTPTQTQTVQPTEVVIEPTRTQTPSATVTDTPTATASPSVTPSDTPTPTHTPTATATETALPTVTTSDTPTNTPTATQTPSATPTATQTPTSTATDTPTPTSTETVTPTTTNTPRPTFTATASATNTPRPTVTPLPTIGPTATNTPTDTLTPSPLPTITPSDTATPRPTSTPRPTNTPTRIPPSPTRTLSLDEIAALTGTAPPAPVGVRETPTPPPTLDVTPTFVTQAVPSPIPPRIVTIPPEEILPPQPGANPDGPTVTPTERIFPTVAVAPEEIPPTVSIDALITPAPPPPGGRPLLNFAITTTGGTVGTGTIPTGGINNTVLFARNPANPDEFAQVNTVGQLYVGPLGSPGGLGGEPFTEFTYQVAARSDNDAAVGDIAYAPDGTLAFIIDAGKVNKDGVWTFQGGMRQLMRDCPREGHPGCFTVRGNRNADQWISEEILWRADSQRAIVRLFLPTEGRYGFVVLDRATANPQVLPRVYRYTHATWSLDGTQVLASGYGEDGQPVMAWIEPDSGTTVGLYNGSAQGIYPQAAIQRTDGAIVALGRPLFGGASFLMDVNGNRLSGDIGATPAVRVKWSGDRSTALVQTQDGRTYTVNAFSGAIQDLSGQAGDLTVDFVPGALPPSAGDPNTGDNSGDTVGVPSGVISGSRYQPGQQLQVASLGGLNIRPLPSTGEAPIGGVEQGEYVAVLAGPVQAEGYEWWQIKTATNIRGWIAGTINGLDTLRVP